MLAQSPSPLSIHANGFVYLNGVKIFRLEGDSLCFLDKRQPGARIPGRQARVSIWQLMEFLEATAAKYSAVRN